MSNEKVNITTDGFSELLNKVLKNIEEERSLALDRYRLQDSQMTDATDFVLQGKDVAIFLKLAADRTDALFSIAKEIKSIVHTDNQSESGSAGISDKERKDLEEFAKNMKKDAKNSDDIKEEINED